MLSHIRKRREECVGASNIATGESNYVLGLLYQYLGQVRTPLGLDDPLALRSLALSLSLFLVPSNPKGQA